MCKKSTIYHFQLLKTPQLRGHTTLENEEKSETFTSQIYTKLEAIEFEKIGSWFQCSECIYSSKRKQNLYNHFQTSHMDHFNELKLAETPNLPKFVCPKCKLSFATRILLSMTTLLKHSVAAKPTESRN